MRHWESMGGEPISGTRADANRELWLKIFEMSMVVGSEDTRAFLSAYGERAQAAILAADGMCWERNCKDCPLSYRSRLSKRSRIAWVGDSESCSAKKAMAVYARMIKKLGKKPEGRS